jgi:hypothetical protein
MHALRFILLTLGFAGFAVGFVLQFRLRYHISKERLLELIDTPHELYRSPPPYRVLSESGRRLFRLMIIGLGVFIICLLTLLLVTLGFRANPEGCIAAERSGASKYTPS